MFLKGFLALLSATLLSTSAGQAVIDLSKSDWTVSNAALNVSVPGNLPSQAHLDLYAAQVIGDPYYGLNDFNLRWVAWSNWTYTATIFGLKSDSSSTWLLFEGLDTFTSISFCGQHIAATNNQFRQYYFDVSTILRFCPIDPVLSINFGSAPNIVDAIQAQPGQETWPTGVELVYEFPNRQFMRKEQSDFGWDWGPAFAPAGPWLPAYCLQLSSSQIYVRNTLIDIYREGQLNNLPPDQSKPWVVNASLDYIGALPAGATLRYTLMDADNKTVCSGPFSHTTMVGGAITGNAIISDGAVKLWWPNGLGPQILYYLTLEVVATPGYSKQQILASVSKRVGFRTIVLDEGVVTQDQIDQGIAPGNNWNFQINGRDFFAKGSNFIPPDAFWPRVTEAKMRQLMASVTIGNQNMLRVWASGAYSPDFVYDIADEMGILMWSEFEFGDALYPVDKEFLNNVFEEVNYQVRRINHHPSLAFWAGGNELENLELLLVNRSAPTEYVRYKDEYETLFLDTIVPAVFGNTRSISYAPSSTSNGYLSLNHSLSQPFVERYENVVPGLIYGETDYYNYNPVVAFDYSSYPIGRFSNEFGFHSMPSLQTWQQAISPRDLTFNSTTIVLRNHHNPPGNLNTTNEGNSLPGMGQMTHAAELWYPVPHKTNSVANFSAWCHTTQIFQADYYRSQIQFYRRGSGFRQRTLGSLYWQLEDIWQAPTWAGIEYDGRWKVLHYGAKDIYSNVIISPFFNISTSELEIYVTSDLWETVSGEASATWFDWSGNRLAVNNGLNMSHFSVGALNTTLIYSGNTSVILSAHNPADVVMEMTVTATGHLPNNCTVQYLTHTNWFHATPLSSARLVDPGLTLHYNALAKTFKVKASRGVAAWVWLDYPAGAVVTFDANGFWLRPGQSRTVGYTVKTDSTGGQWVKGVTVQSLWNNTMST